MSRPVPAVPHAPPPTPKGAQVNRMVFVVGSKPVDTNGNGYPDRIEATVTLFASPHPMPLWEDGRIVCSMYMKGEAHGDDLPPIVEWSYEGADLAQARSISSIGPQYMLRLNLLKLGSDRLPFNEVDVVCRFEPIGGRKPVHCDGVRSIQIGRRGPG